MSHKNEKWQNKENYEQSGENHKQKTRNGPNKTHLGHGNERKNKMIKESPKEKEKPKA